jgi:hypothetical protein
MNLKGVLGGLLPYGPGIAEHVVLTAGLDPARAPGRSPLADAEVAALFRAVQQLEGWFAALEGEEAPKGFITTARAGGPSKRQRAKAAAAAAERGKPQAAAAGGAEGAAPDGGMDGAAAAGTDAPAGGGGAGSAAAAAGGAAVTATATAEAEGAVVYEDFNPLRLAQSAGDGVVDFECFDGALDEFYSKVGFRGFRARSHAAPDSGARRRPRARGAGPRERQPHLTSSPALTPAPRPVPGPRPRPPSKIAGQRSDVAKADAERAAVTRLDRVKQDQVGWPQGRAQAPCRERPHAASCPGRRLSWLKAPKHACATLRGTPASLFLRGGSAPPTLTSPRPRPLSALRSPPRAPRPPPERARSGAGVRGGRERAACDPH